MIITKFLKFFVLTDLFTVIGALLTYGVIFAGKLLLRILFLIFEHYSIPGIFAFIGILFCAYLALMITIRKDEY